MFNISKLSVAKQCNISKLINYASDTNCSTIASPEYKSIESDGNNICVSIIYIYKCLILGKLSNRDICISHIPQILRTQQTNALFDNITMCISQCNNNLFERYIIQSLLYSVNANHSKTFHAKRCDVLI